MALEDQLQLTSMLHIKETELKAAIQKKVILISIVMKRILGRFQVEQYSDSDFLESYLTE